MSPIEVNAVIFGIQCSFPRVCGEARTKEAVCVIRAMQRELEEYQRLGPIEHIRELVEAEGRHEKCKEQKCPLFREG